MDGEDDMLYVVNGLGGEEETTRMSWAVIFSAVKKTLRWARLDLNGRNDRVEIFCWSQ